MTYLMHHGVKGMKWGVRRYQKYGGSYTRKGLEIYSKSRADYDSKKQTYKTAKKKTGDASKARDEYLQAKWKKNKDRKQLSRDYKADKGKALYQQGKTIRGSGSRTRILAGITSAVMFAGGYYVNKQINDGKRVGDVLSDPYTLGLGVAVVAGSTATTISQIRDSSNDAKLRAYYSHSRP